MVYDQIFLDTQNPPPPPPPPPPTNNFYLYSHRVLRCFWKDPLMTPHHPTSSILHCYPPSPSTTPPPPLKILIIHMARFFNFLFQLKLSFHKIKYLSNNQPWDIGFSSHLGFIDPTELRFVGYSHLGVG